MPFGSCSPRPSAGQKTLTTSRLSKNPDDIVITLAARTPLCKARKGGFKDTSLEYMIYALLKEVRERSNVDPKLVEDIALGNVRFSPSPSPLSPLPLHTHPPLADEQER